MRAFLLDGFVCEYWGSSAGLKSKNSLSESGVLAHKYVPKHEVLSSEEVEALLKKYGVSLNQLPSILASDPVAQEFEARPGEVIKITRESLTSGKSVYYRVVVRD